MKFSKKIISFMLIMALALVSVRTDAMASTYSDAAKKLKDAHLYLFDTDEDYDSFLTRGEAVKLFIGALRNESTVNTYPEFVSLCTFKDVPDAYKGYVGFAVKLGLMQPLDKDIFGVSTLMERGEFYQVLLKFLNYENASTNTEELITSLGFVPDNLTLTETIKKGEAVEAILKMLNTALGDGTNRKFGEYLEETGLISKKVSEKLGVKKDTIDTENVHILYFNDFHGNVSEETTGKKRNMGMAKMVGYVNEFVANHPNTIVLSGGDNYQGTADSNITFGAPVSYMLKKMNTVASSVGNHEFDWGADRISKWAKDGKFTYLASNIYDKNTNKPVDWAKPYMVVKVGNIKIGIIGLAHSETPSLTKAEYVRDFRFEDPVKSAKKWVKFLKSGKAEGGKPHIIVALTHIDSAQDSKTKEITGPATDLANKVPGLDLVLSAHSHQIVNGKVNNVPVLQAYCYGRAIGHIKLDVKKDTKPIKKKTKVSAKPRFKVKNLQTEIFFGNTIKDKVVPDEKTEREYLRLQDELRPLKGEILGVATDVFSHDRNLKGSVTPLGNWTCLTMAKATGADIAIQNGGGLRRTLNKGNITMGDLYEIMPFDNYLVVMDLPGKDLKKAIDHGIYMPSTTDGAFTGLIVEYDSSKPHGNRITKITLPDGTPIEDEKFYKVVMNDFMFTGGDGYNFFKNAKNINETYIPVRDVLVEEIKKVKEITPNSVDYIKDIKR